MDSPAAVTNPYVGPRTFSSAERGLFFGRDAEARELLSLVVSQRLVLFYAQSGAGKSSLLNARLAPDLAERGFTVLPIARVGAEVPRGIEQVDNVFLFSLMLSLDQGGGDPARLTQLSLSDFLTCLTSDDGQHYYYADSHELAAEASPVIGSTPPANPQSSAEQYDEPNFVLIIDQFEEIFTTHLQHWEDRTAFFEQLEQAMKQDPKMWVVLTLREDYVAALDPYAHQLADKLRARYYMQRLGKEAALQAVQNPARLAGRPFDAGVAGQLVDNLSQIQILGEADNWPGQYVEPVQLQVVCYQLWENLKNDPPGLITSANLAAYGNVDNALADFYNRTIKEVVGLPEVQVSELQLRLWFSKQLITEAGTRSIIDQGKETTRGMPNHVVKALADRYLLRAEPRAGAIWIELVHDRFVAPIRRANRDAEAAQKEFEAAENARQEAERQRVQAEIRTSRRLRRLTVALVVVSLIAVVAAIVAWNAAQLAQGQYLFARQKQIEAETASAQKDEIVKGLRQAIETSGVQAIAAPATAQAASTRAANLQATADAGAHLPPATATALAADAQAAATWAVAAQATAQVAVVQATAQAATARFLNVPYKNQNDPDADLKRFDDGAASVAMILGALGQSVTTNAVTAAVNQQGDNGVTPSQLVSAARAFGLEMGWSQGFTLDNLKQFLDKGQPPIALVKYANLPDRVDKGLTGGHYVVVVGYDDTTQSVFINDPDYFSNTSGGYQKSYSYQTWMSAWGGFAAGENSNFSLIYPTQQGGAQSAAAAQAAAAQATAQAAAAQAAAVQATAQAAAQATVQARPQATAQAAAAQARAQAAAVQATAQAVDVPSGSPLTLAELLALPLEPRQFLDAPNTSDQAAVNAARIWNKYGGFIGPLSKKLGIDPAVAVAVLAVQSSGRGFEPDGRMDIRFENHLFWTYWGKANASTYNQFFQFDQSTSWKGHQYRLSPNDPWLDVHQNQNSEWAAFNLASTLDAAATKKSISMGLVQIMGFNNHAIGYDTPEAMFTSFSLDERFQVLSFFNFIKNDQRMITALQNRDFVGFARIYNGPGQPDVYGGLMKGVADGFSSLQPAMASPVPWGKSLAGVGMGISQPLTKEDLRAIADSKVEAVKILTLPDAAESKQLVTDLRQIRPDMFIVARLAYSIDLINKTKFSPQDFVDSVDNGMKALYDSGVRYFEIHNEPNLEIEGMYWNWASGAEFGNWFTQVYNILKERYPEAKLGYPGLSPQPNVDAFLEGSSAAANSADWIGVHAYWQQSANQPPYPINGDNAGYYWRAKFQPRFPNKLLMITEFSNNSAGVDPQVKGQQYAQYYKMLRNEPNIGAAFGFALSWPGQDNNHEAWTGSAIPGTVGALIGQAGYLDGGTQP